MVEQIPGTIKKDHMYERSSTSSKAGRESGRTKIESRSSTSMISFTEISGLIAKEKKTLSI